MFTCWELNPGLLGKPDQAILLRMPRMCWQHFFEWLSSVGVYVFVSKATFSVLSLSKVIFLPSRERRQYLHLVDCFAFIYSLFNSNHLCVYIGIFLYISFSVSISPTTCFHCVSYVLIRNCSYLLPCCRWAKCHRLLVQAYKGPPGPATITSSGTTIASMRMSCRSWPTSSASRE